MKIDNYCDNQKNPCNGHGICISSNDNIKKYTCNCNASYTGKDCEICKLIEILLNQVA